MFFQDPRNLQSALRRRFRIGAENKRHSVTGRQPSQFSFRLGLAKFVGAANHFIELTQQFALLIHQ